jgi:hypothetical protein
MSAQTIQIFLPDGNPRGLKIADIVSRNVKVISIPRAQLALAYSRRELRNVGFYFLVNEAHEGEFPETYVGEGEDCEARLKTHNRKLDFWTTALVVMSKTQFFTKTHVKFLEAHSYQEAKRAARYKLQNTNVPARPFVAEALEADLLDNFHTAAILVAALGHPLFDPIPKPRPDQVLTLSGKGVVARGEYTEDGLVVFTGSFAHGVETRSAPSWIRSLRARLIEGGVLVPENGAFRFTRDYIFNAPSPAAGVVLAKNVDGWHEWRYSDGRSLHEVVRATAD